MGFLSRFFASHPKIDEVAKISCNDGFSIIVQACDSSVDTSDGQIFIRHYNLLLQPPATTTAQEFIVKHNGNRDWLQPDGTIQLCNFSGDGHYIAESLSQLADDIKKYGIDLPQDTISAAISRDIKNQGDIYMQPIAAKKQADLVAKKRQASKPVLEKVATVECEGGLTYVISGYDSTLRVNGEDEPIRRYSLYLRANDEVMEDFLRKNGRDEKTIKDVMKNKLASDGTLGIESGITGHIDFFPEHVQNLSQLMKARGFELPVQAIEAAILQDMDRHASKTVPARVAGGGR